MTITLTFSIERSHPLTRDERAEAAATVRRQRRCWGVVRAARDLVASIPATPENERDITLLCLGVESAERVARLDLFGPEGAPLSPERAEAILAGAEETVRSIGAERAAMPDVTLTAGCPDCGENLYRQTRSGPHTGLPLQVDRCHGCGFERPARLTNGEF